MVAGVGRTTTAATGLRDANASKEIPKLLAGEKYDYSNWQGFLHWSGIGSSDVIVQNSKQLESFAKVYAEVKDVKAGTNVSPTATANQPTTNTPSLPNPPRPHLD